MIKYTLMMILLNNIIFSNFDFLYLTIFSIYTLTILYISGWYLSLVRLGEGKLTESLIWYNSKSSGSLRSIRTNSESYPKPSISVVHVIPETLEVSVW